MGETHHATARIGFIGGGNMAEALVRGLLEAALCGPESLRICEPIEARRHLLTERYGVETSADTAAVAGWAELLVLAVKPSVVVPAVREAAPFLSPEALVLSIAAGVAIADIEAELPAGRRVIRAMPNTAVLVRAGASAVSGGTAATPDDLARAVAIFEAVGQCVQVPEKLLDAVTGLSGSGPAYVMLMIEGLADGGVRAGLPRDVAQRLAAQTVFGAAKLQIDSGDHPAVLKDRVTSPGGTTIAGLEALEARAVRGALIEAVVAASARSAELGR